VFFGYNVDYESSVFAIEHLRKAIRTIAATPGVQRIHLIAHSRGSDLLVSALSGLSMEGYTQQSTLPQRYKIGNVVLMAPDMDIDVANAKLFSVLSDPDVPYGPAPKPDMVIPPSPWFHLTIYASPDDKALAASSWLFGSIARLGRLNQDMLTPEQIRQARTLGIIDIIQVRGTTGYIGHSYFTSNPEVSADLIAMLRYGLQPNDPGRPLKEIDKPFWRLLDEADTGAEK
jgi:esterase/lipase superfamily enzyme